MTPYRGIGANVALKDAMRLCHTLTGASRGQRPVLEAIHDYATEMIDYGFRAVRTSLRAMNQTIVESRLHAMLSRTFLKVHQPRAAAQAADARAHGRGIVVGVAEG